MNRRQILLSAAGAALAAPGLMAAGPGWTPLDLTSGLVFVPGHIDDQPVEMLLDSGSAPTLVDLTWARRLGLPLSGDGTALGTGGGATPVTRTGGFALSVAGVAIHFPADSVLALDLAGLARGGRPISVIVGQALFEAARIDLDLPRSRLALGEAAPGRGWASLPLTTEAEGLRCMPVRIGARAGVAATFDLGSSFALQVTRDWAEAHGVLRGLRQSTWIATGIDGPSRVGRALLPEIELAGSTMRDVPVAIIDTQPEGGSPSVIGLPVWNRFRLVCDYAAATLWLRPGGGRLNKPFSRDRSGLAVNFTGDALEVMHVAAASPAETGGWSVGERIVAVDGRRVDAAWSGGRQSGWARQRAGSRVRLTLATGAERDLVLADYY